MTFYEISIVTTLSATLALMCVYFFLYSLYRQAYIGLWAVFWLVHFFAQITYLTPLHQMSPRLSATLQFLSIANHVLLVFATSKFLKIKMYNAWYYWAIGITIVSQIAMFIHAPFLMIALPSCIFVGLVYIWHGFIFIGQLDSKSWGKNTVGISFLGLGIHAFDMPFLISASWFAPFGFLISGILRFIISMGILMLFVEKNWRELAAKEQQYRLLAENAVDVIYLYRLKPTRGFDFISPSIAKLTGYSVDEYYASPDMFFSAVHPSDSFLIESLVNNPVDLSDKPLMVRLLRRDHVLLWIEQTTVPIFDIDGTCISFQGIIRDISARKNLEQDVSRLERLNTVGQMAANVAHEIRNPLTTVHGYLQFFLNKTEFANYHDHFHLLLSELDRANLIIKEYLSLCQNKVRDLKLAPLNHVITDLYPLIQADAVASSKDIRLNLEVIPDIYFDEKEIRQLILNLVRNGLEATDSGGCVTIQTHVNENKEAVLAIKDEGKGIPEHVLENLGKPFLTTKDNGTGLGLAVVYRIANNHQAKVKVESSSDGTTFYIVFTLK